MNMTLSLSNKLDSESKKFSKACEQIKLLKQQLAVYVAMFADFSDMQENTNLSESSCPELQQLQNRHSGQPLIDFNLNVSKEMVRQKIETLQEFKKIYFTYAHRKADEITKIQCELYGEDAVRNAYDNSETHDSEIQVNSETGTESQIEPESLTDPVFDSSTSDTIENNLEHESNTWSSYLNNYEQDQNQQITTNRPSQPLQLTEYDFLTA